MFALGLLVTLVGAALPGPGVSSSPKAPKASLSRRVAQASRPAVRPAPRRPGLPQRVSVFLRRSALKVVNNQVLFRPGRRARRSRYYTYRFDRTEFKRKVGPIAKVNLRMIYCEVKNRQIKTHQIPVGTITTVIYDCGITLFGTIRPFIQQQRKKGNTPQVKDFHKVKIILSLPRDNRQLMTRKAIGREAYYTATTRGRPFKWMGQMYVKFDLISTRVRSSTYLRLLIPLKEFHEQAGRVAYKKLLMRVRITDVLKKTWKPKKNMPSPVGGFTTYTVFASIIQAIVK